MGRLPRGASQKGSVPRHAKSGSPIGLLSLLFCSVLVAFPAIGNAEGRAVIVKFRSEGRSALHECAERTFRAGRRFETVSTARSDSLDRLHGQIRPTRVRALFRSGAGLPLREERQLLRRRLSRRLRSPATATRVPELANVYRVALPPDTPVETALALYREDPHVEWVQADHPQRLDALPNDPFVSSSGSWGQDFEDLWGWHRIRAPEAWELSRGEGVVVAVVDTGVDYLHPDIAGNMWVHPGEDLNGNGRVDPFERNGLDDDGNGFADDFHGFDFAASVDADRNGNYTDPGDVSDPDPMDERGHGTHVAGTIAAVAGNGIGIAGVAPEARIMALKGFPASGPGLDSDLWRAVLYAAENGAQVINNSWSCRPACPENPLAEEIVALVHAMGAIIVTSAGNRGEDVVWNSPENLRETIVVASTGQDDEPSPSFTNHGWLVDLGAPGGGPTEGREIRVSRRNILSLRASADEEEAWAVEGIYSRSAGTSMASPHVAGTVALLRARDPSLGYEQIRRRLRQSSLDLGPEGHDPGFGGGRLDARAALEIELPDLDAAITSPRPTRRFSPAQQQRVVIEGRAAGADFAAYRLSVGSGNEPADWTPIVESSQPVPDGVLGLWSISEALPGSYVVRLEVEANTGEIYQEFVQLSLENGHFDELSERDTPAYRPDVSGSRVVWEAEPGPETEGGEDPGRDLFVADVRSGQVARLAGGPGEQTEASIAGRLVSWRDSSSEGSSLFGCRLRLRLREDLPACSPFLLAPDSDSPQRPATTHRRFHWLDTRSGELDLRSCRPRGRSGCLPGASGLPETRRVFLRTDGRSLSWSEAGSRTSFCTPGWKTGRCAAEEPFLLRALSRPIYSDGLLAWVEFGFGTDTPLVACEIGEPGTGACEPVRVAAGVRDVEPELSGDRLVWSMRVGDEDSDVFFCEYDRIRERCPVQRLTANMGDDGLAAIDGTRIAWQSERFGASSILTTELPSLGPVRDRRAPVGRPLWILLNSDRGDSSRALDLSAEIVGAPNLESANARFFDAGTGRGLLLWWPRPDQVGSQIVTFSGRSVEGLTTRRSIRIEVLKATRGSGGDQGTEGSAPSGVTSGS